MSTFAEKIRKGILPSEEDWERHLIEAHAQQPRMTPEAFAGFRTEGSLNSYEILANHLPAPPQDRVVVDLACGDGHLIPYLLARLGPNARIVGVDMSGEGLAVARSNVDDPRVGFTLARAQSLPLTDASVDHILCHMAFMLMSPIEPVVSEIARVLKPGGQLVAVIGGGTSTGLYKEIQRLTSLFVHSHLPRYGEARTGSKSVSKEAGLNALFAEGFEFPVRLSEFQLRYHVAPDGIWEYLKNMYFTPMLPLSARKELQDELMALARDHLDGDGKVLFNVPMRCFSVKRDR